MLAIARALVSDPKVMLLDEPSQGLAPLVVRELAEVIRRLPSEGVTILLIEQNMRLAEAVADEIHIMVKGRMVYGATPDASAPRKKNDPGALSHGVTGTTGGQSRYDARRASKASKVPAAWAEAFS